MRKSKFCCLHLRTLPRAGIVSEVGSKSHRPLYCMWKWLSPGRQASGGENSPRQLARGWPHFCVGKSMPAVTCSPNLCLPVLGTLTSASGGCRVNGNGGKNSFQKQNQGLFLVSDTGLVSPLGLDSYLYHTFWIFPSIPSDPLGG